MRCGFGEEDEQEEGDELDVQDKMINQKGNFTIIIN